MRLLKDVCRCHDRKCGVRNLCGRYIDNVEEVDGDECVLHAHSLKEEDDDKDCPCDFYIEEKRRWR